MTFALQSKSGSKKLSDTVKDVRKSLRLQSDQISNMQISGNENTSPTGEIPLDTSKNLKNKSKKDKKSVLSQTTKDLAASWSVYFYRMFWTFNKMIIDTI